MTHVATASTAPAPRRMPALTSDESTELARLRRREPAACERLVRQHTARLVSVARRILRDEEAARDAVQEAWGAAFRRLDDFDGRARIGTWLHRIVVNAALMRLRARAVRPETGLEDLLPGFETDGSHAYPTPEWRLAPDELIARRELRERVRRAIDRLPEGYRTVLLLRDIEELDTEATAVAMGLTRVAVKVRLHRARQALRTLLESDLSTGRA